jgi:signal peptidase I
VPRGTWLAAAALGAAALIGVGIATTVDARGLHASRVVSRSMSPAILKGDWIATRDLDRSGRRTLGRRDIVLFRFPLGTSGRAVKRVVAVAGDRVAISPRTVVVGDRVIPIGGAPSEGAARRRVETVPDGAVFLLGDNAAVSIDSRSFGSVPETEIVGRVVFVIHRRTLFLAVGIAAALVGVVAALFLARRTRGVFARRTRRA